MQEPNLPRIIHSITQRPANNEVLLYGLLLWVEFMNNGMRGRQVTQDLLKEYFNYDPNTGVFTRIKHTSSKAKVGYIAGTIDKIKCKAYIKISIDHKGYGAHRLAWLYVYGEWPKNEIDHIDGNGLNNAISNLRDVTSAENRRNQRINTNNLSGHIGVSLIKKGKWQAYINVNKKQIRIGYFNNIEDAIKAREKASSEYGYHENHGAR